MSFPQYLICVGYLCGGMAKEKPRIYWDASCFLAFLLEEEGRVDACEEVLNRAKAGEFLIFTSFLSLSEVVHLKGKPKLTQDNEQMLRDFFEHPFFRFVTVDRRVAEMARQLMWKHPHLRAYDANHIASAYSVGIQKIHAYDADFKKCNGLIVGASGDVIRITEPDIAVQTKLGLT